MSCPPHPFGVSGPFLINLLVLNSDGGSYNDMLNMNILIIRKLFLCVVYIVKGETHYAHLDDLYVISRCFIDRFEHHKLQVIQAVTF